MHLHAVGSHRGLVLVAAYNDRLRRVLLDALVEAGYDVAEAADGLELYDYLEAAVAYDARLPVPDVVVVDARLPGPSMRSTLEMLRALAGPVPVVAINRAGDEVGRDVAEQIGALAVLAKPVDPGDVVDAVGRFDIGPPGAVAN